MTRAYNTVEELMADNLRVCKNLAKALKDSPQSRATQIMSLSGFVQGYAAAMEWDNVPNDFRHELEALAYLHRS